VTGYGSLRSSFGRFILILLVGPMVLGAESLWKPGFPGYAAAGGGHGMGDLISVLLDADTVLSLNSVQTSDDTTQLSFSGGDAGELTSFLPSADSSSNRSVEAKHDLSFSTSLAARVIGKDDSGALLISGRRQILINGTREEVSIEGTVAPDAVVEGGVRFEDIADAKLVYLTNAFPAGEVLGENDLRYDTVPPVVASDGAQGAADQSVSGENSRPSLSQQRQRELLRAYMNRFLQLLFPVDSPPSVP